MRWPWRRPNGDAAQAKQDAADAYTAAAEKSEQVDRLAAAAQRLARHSDWFTQSMEQALHLRRA